MDTQERNRIILQGAARLAVLRKLALIDTPEEPFFDRMTRLASTLIGTPVSLVSMVAGNYQFFKSSYGLPEPWQSQRRTPLSHSFCQHVVTSGEPLVVEDARVHSLLMNNRAIPDLNVIGYLGMPLQTADGYRLGSFCVIDGQPHTWTDEEIQVMWAFSEVINAEIDARATAYAQKCLDQYIFEEPGGLDQLENELLSAGNVEDQIDALLRYRDKILVERG